jgi:lipoprotein-releasing system ATP-binding protein
MLLEAKHINKSFHDPVTVPILKDVSIEIPKGQFTSIVGKSGCGKSTLLYILSTMDTDYEGELWIDGENLQVKPRLNWLVYAMKRLDLFFNFITSSTNLVCSKTSCCQD